MLHLYRFQNFIHNIYIFLTLPAFRALRKLVNDQQGDWDIFLDATLFSLRSKVHTTTKHTPFLLMYGREARFPAEVPAELPVSIWCVCVCVLEEYCRERGAEKEKLRRRREGIRGRGE